MTTNEFTAYQLKKITGVEALMLLEKKRFMKEVNEFLNYSACVFATASIFRRYAILNKAKALYAKYINYLNVDPMDYDDWD